MPSLFLLLIAAFVSNHAHAQETLRCKELTWKPGDVIVTESQMNQHTSIQLPENAIDVFWGSKGLWESEWVKNKVLIKPNTDQPEGMESTFTAIGESGNAYEILARRVKHRKSHCLIVKTGGAMINRAVWDARDAQTTAQTTAMAQEITRLNADKAKDAKDVQRQVQETLNTYRKTIKAAYEWSNGNIIDSVYDDGRFTFIRLTNDDRGLMAITAVVDGKSEIIEAPYDASTRTYRVVGIFPGFKLKAGDSELTITRKRV